MTYNTDYYACFTLKATVKKFYTFVKNLTIISDSSFLNNRNDLYDHRIALPECLIASVSNMPSSNTLIPLI